MPPQGPAGGGEQASRPPPILAPRPADANAPAHAAPPLSGHARVPIAAPASRSRPAGQEPVKPVSEPAGDDAAPLSDAAPTADAPPSVEPDRERGLRPAAPMPPAERRLNLRGWIVAGVSIVVLAGIAYAAWALRDRPEDIAPPVAGTPAPPAEPGGKIAERIGGGAGRAAGDESSPIPTVQVPAVPVGPDGAPQQPAVPVAQRAAMLIEAPEETSKVKVMVGTALWRVESVPGDEGRPPVLGLRAEIDIPEARMRIGLNLRRNDDASLAASHTLEIRFELPEDAPFGTVRELGIPEMRREETPNGERLAAVAVPVTSSMFLVGFTRGEREEALNLDLLTSRNWLDIPMLMSTGRVAKVTFEKGTSGDRVLNQVVESWKNAP